MLLRYWWFCVFDPISFSLLSLFCLLGTRSPSNKCKYAYSVLFHLHTNFSYHLVKFKHFNDLVMRRYGRFCVYYPLSVSFWFLVNLGNLKVSAPSVIVHILYSFSYIPTLATIWWSLNHLMTLYCFDIDDFMFLTPFQSSFFSFVSLGNPKGSAISVNMHILYSFNYIQLELPFDEI